jgi:hypothetical protein
MKLTVNERARALATFRHVEVRLMEITAAWTPTTPEMEVKGVFGRHIWDFAQHADWIGKRTFELRQPEHYTLDPSPDYLALLARVADANGTAVRVGMLYDFFIPALLRRYRSYLDAVDRLLDGPSVVVVERILAEYDRMLAEAAQLKRAMKIETAIAPELAAHENGLQLVAQR